MALDIEHGVFTKQAGTGNQTVTLVDSGITPKFIMFHGDGYGTANGIVNDFYAPFKGWTSTTESLAWCQSIQSNNKNGQAGLYDGCILILDEDSATEAKATIVSMSAGSFVINWGTNANTTACRIGYTVYGGSDLTDIKIGAGALNTSTGNQSFTPTTFTPKIAFFAAVGGLTTFPTDSVGNTGTGTGVAVSSSKRFSIGGAVKGDKGHSHFEDTKCIIYALSSDTALDLEADFVSFNTDGFTINITDAPTTADQLGYVLLGGTDLTVDAGSFTSPTSTGTDAITTTDTPSVVGLETSMTEVGDTYGGTNDQAASYGIGVSATSRFNHTATNPDNKTPESASSDLFVIQGYLPVATLTASTEDADIDSFNATDFTLDWTKVSTTAYEYGWWMLGGAAGASHSIVGSIAVSVAIAAALVFNQNPSISGDVTVTPTVSSAMAYNQNPSIDGAVTVTSTIASSMVYAVGVFEYVINGAVTVPSTVSASMVYNQNPSISGSVLVPVSVGAALDHNINPSIAGAVNVTPTIAATLVYNQNPSIDGAITVPVSIASAMDYTLVASIDGSIIVNPVIASTMFYSSGDSILGDITVNISIASAMDYIRNTAINGAVSVGIAVNSAMDYSRNASIDGNVPVGITINSSMDYTLNASIDGAVTIGVSINSAMDYTPDLAYGGTYNAAESFPTSSTVTISLYNPVTGGSISLDDNVCPEIATGIYVWDSSKLTTQPSGYQEYVWSMTDSVTVKGGIINMFDTADSANLTEVLTKMTELWKFKGLDVSNPVARGGDQVTSETLTVDGEVLTITPTTISRS